MSIKNHILRLKEDGSIWLVREARTIADAVYEIGHARALGSIGSRSDEDRTRVGGTVIVLADVHQLNSDRTERKPYQAVY